MTTEENYDISRYASFAFFIGTSSYKFLHNILQEPSPKFDEHATLREKNNRFVHTQYKMHKDGGIDMLGYTVKL